MKRFVAITLLLLAATALQTGSLHDQAWPPKAAPQPQPQPQPQVNPQQQPYQRPQPQPQTQPNTPQYRTQPQPQTQPQYRPQPQPNQYPQVQPQTFYRPPAPTPVAPKPAITFSTTPGVPNKSQAVKLPPAFNKPGFDSVAGDPFGASPDIKRTCFQAPCYVPTAKCAGSWHTILYIVPTSSGQKARFVGYECRATPVARRA